MKAWKNIFALALLQNAQITLLYKRAVVTHVLRRTWGLVKYLLASGLMFQTALKARQITV
jgi:hypothetical protein